MEINTKMHLLELFTMIHCVRKQIKYILVNERPRDISLARLNDLPQQAAFVWLTNSTKNSGWPMPHLNAFYLSRFE